MDDRRDFEKSRAAAFRQVASSLKLEEALPSQVFRGDNLDFLFFEADRVFTPSFVEVVIELMSVEGANSSCLSKIDRSNEPSCRVDSAIFIEDGMTPAVYDAQIRRGGPASGWLFGVDHYGCASDVGNWIIYCEKDNDVAVIALRGRNAVDLFLSPITKLHAKGVDALIRQGSSAPFPFNSLVLSWRTGLSSQYGAQAL